MAISTLKKAHFNFSLILKGLKSTKAYLFENSFKLKILFLKFLDDFYLFLRYEEDLMELFLAATLQYPDSIVLGYPFLENPENRRNYKRP